MKYINLLGEERECKRSLSELLLDELAKDDTAQELCKQLIERAKQGDNAAFKIIKDMIGEQGVIL